MQVRCGAAVSDVVCWMRVTMLCVRVAGRAVRAVGHRHEARPQRCQALHRRPQRLLHLLVLRREELEGHQRPSAQPSWQQCRCDPQSFRGSCRLSSYPRPAAARARPADERLSVSTGMNARRRSLARANHSRNVAIGFAPPAALSASKSSMTMRPAALQRARDLASAPAGRSPSRARDRPSPCRTEAPRTAGRTCRHAAARSD